VGVSSIGDSRIIQHWDIPLEMNKAKEALSTGMVDVLTLSPIFLPDAGIENFTTLALGGIAKCREHREHHEAGLFTMSESRQWPQ
jgi:hypothetical protein